jgi:DNA-binding response OmpR family regulator
MMPKNILLIENDPDLRNIISYILQSEGYVVSCMGIFEDLEEIAAHHPDLILIDEWVSQEPGHRLCLKIKTLERMMHIPVIILSTADGIEQIMTECKANAFVRKPFDLDDLTCKVKQMLSEVSA